MKRFLFIVMVFYLGHFIHAQEKQDNITLSFDNYTKIEVFDHLANVTGYTFYYIDTWFNDELISKNYTDASIEELLNDLLLETTLNYFILNENKIILTENNIIYAELPEDFFGKDTTNPQKSTIRKTYVNPIFHNEIPLAKDQELKTYRIGKENLHNNQKTYNLSGTIKNLENGESLSNISIVVKNQNKGTTSDSNGFYELDLEPGINLLEFSAIGFKSLEARVIIYNQGNLDIGLNERIEHLDEVIVAASLHKNVENTSMGTEEINVEESKNIPLVLGERDVLKVATSLPGISTAGEASAGFNVRGGSSDQNLILLDDAGIYNPQHFFGIFSALNPFSIGEVKIHKASIPVSYGGRLSSVIDIKTKKGNSQKFSGEASIGPVTGNLLLEVPIVKESSSLLLGGRGAYANWILRSLDEESLNNSQASFYDAIASYSHKFNENTNIKATGYYSKDDFSITSDSLYVYSNSLFSIKSNHRLNNKNNLSLLVTNSNYMFNIEYDRSADDSFLFNYSINETTAKA